MVMIFLLVTSCPGINSQGRQKSVCCYATSTKKPNDRPYIHYRFSKLTTTMNTCCYKWSHAHSICEWECDCLNYTLTSFSYWDMWPYFINSMSSFYSDNVELCAGGQALCNTRITYLSQKSDYRILLKKHRRLYNIGDRQRCLTYLYICVNREIFALYG